MTRNRLKALITLMLAIPCGMVAFVFIRLSFLIFSTHVIGWSLGFSIGSASSGLIMKFLNTHFLIITPIVAIVSSVATIILLRIFLISVRSK